jgi:single-strand DNA-binding protein
MNIVMLVGRLSSAPRCTELPSGTVRWNLEVSCTVPDGRVLGVPVSWESDVPDTWDTGTEVAVAGVVRRRFFRVGGSTQSRTEVEAASIVEVTKRRSASQAVARAAKALGDQALAAMPGALAPV